MLTLRQLAAHILSLSDDVQALPATYYNEACYVFVNASSPLSVMYREPDGYPACVEVDGDHSHHGQDYLSSLTKVAVIGG